MQSFLREPENFLSSNTVKNRCFTNKIVEWQFFLFFFFYKEIVTIKNSTKNKEEHKNGLQSKDRP